MSKIAIGIRCFGNPDSMFHRSLIRFLQLNKTQNTMLLPTVYDLPYHVAANEISKLFLDSGYDNLLFLDSDMVFEYEDFLKIKADIEDPKNDKYGIISGLYPTRRGKLMPLVMFKQGDAWVSDVTKLVDGITTVDGCGLGFTVVRRKCFDLPCFKDSPYFVMKEEVSEDVYFCEAVKEHGILTGLDKDINLGHRTAVTVKWYLKDNKADLFTQDCFGRSN